VRSSSFSECVNFTDAEKSVEMEVVEQHELAEHVQLVEHIEQVKRKQGRPPSVSHAIAIDDERKSIKKSKARKTRDLTKKQTI
jgi:hypothetical protein